MHPIDLTIIALYLAADGGGRLVVAKKASQNAESYFLAGKSLPWWIIGVAHGSSGVDITGTMWFVMMLYIYGVKATWLLWVWPLFNVIFRMMYLGTWVRRSNVLTGAEWMRTRFGYSRGRRARLPERRGLRAGPRRRLPQLRLPRHRRVHPALLPLGLLRRVLRAPAMLLDHRRLLRRRRHVQRGHERPDSIRAEGHRRRRHRRHRHPR